MPVIRATIEEPLQGAWVADIEIHETDEELGTFNAGGATWVGHIVRSRIEGGVRKLRIVGGTASISQRVASRSIRDDSLSALAKDLLLGTDLELEGAKEIEVPFYCLLGGPLGIVLSKLASTLAAPWYVTRSGKVSLAAREPKAIEAPRIATDIEAAVYLVCETMADVLPGDTYEGAEVRHVRWRLTPKQLLAELSFDELYRPADPSLGYEISYAAKIVSGDYDERTASVLVAGELGIPDVPVLVGGPLRIRTESGDLCRVAFEGGDPRRPYLFSFSQRGDKRVARESDTVDCGKLMFVDSGPTGPEILTWIPPATEAMPVPVPVVIGASPTDIFGVISSGSDDVSIP